MSERFWFLSVGPFDEGQIVGWVESLPAELHEAAQVELVDSRQWYARAMDVDTVRDALVALREGLATSRDDSVRLSVTGLVSDMETWLEREYDPGSE